MKLSEQAEGKNFECCVNQMVRRLEIEGFEVKTSVSENQRKLEMSIKKEKERTEFMEDRIEVGFVTELEELLTAEELKLMPKGYSAYVLVELWRKDASGITCEDVETIRFHVNNLAKQLDLLKVFMWGMDDGGAAMFETKGKLVYRSYINRFGELELNEVGPKSEEEFWEGVKSIEWC